MKQDLNIGKIESKFQELIGLDQNYAAQLKPDFKKDELGSFLSAVSSIPER